MGHTPLAVRTNKSRDTYTLFLMCSLSGDWVASVNPGSSTAETYVSFITEALEASDSSGLPLLKSQGLIISDNASVHHAALPIIMPSLQERDVDYAFLPVQVCCFNLIYFVSANCSAYQHIVAFKH